MKNFVKKKVAKYRKIVLDIYDMLCYNIIKQRHIVIKQRR